MTSRLVRALVGREIFAYKNGLDKLVLAFWNKMGDLIEVNKDGKGQRKLNREHSFSLAEEFKMEG